MTIKFHVIYLFKLAIKISPDGKFIATAQNTFPGFPADITIWNFSSQ